MVTTPRILIAGRLSRDFVVFPKGEPLLNVPGGNTLYSSIGVIIWETNPPPGMIARVGEDYPQSWLEVFRERGIDTSCVRVIPEAIDVRNFTAFTDSTTRSNEEPVTHFARLGISFPRDLLGYQKTIDPVDSRTKLLPTSLRREDISDEFLNATAAHICPIDYLSHSMLPSVFRQAGFTTVTLDPSSGYMNPTYWIEVSSLLTGLTAFIPAQEELHNLFKGRSDDLWEMAEGLAAFGCEFIIIKCGERGQLLYDSASKSRWEIPPYPARLVNPIGAGDAFCGGFIAGFHQVYDPLEATLYGNISASMVVEGHDPIFALDALPGLAEARLHALRSSVRKA
jgi:sugar/nucleoside kinase (ribokinase family)